MNTTTTNKNIILCSDGTGQSGGGGFNTNVWRIYDAIDINHPDVKQLAYYDDGVGTNNNAILKGLGLAFGLGLSKNIRQLYKYAVMYYTPGDHLYLFGFSRGSHTIRLLAELICTFGLLNPKSFDNEKALDIAILALQKKFKSGIRKAWFSNIFSKKITDTSKTIREQNEQILESKRKDYQKQNLEEIIRNQSVTQNKDDLQQDIFNNIKIQFLGVWDTVSAVGMPIEEMRNNFFFAHHAFVDHKLNDKVKKARHALAIDEKRHTFKPELWDQSDETDDDRIEQVWFSGVHANVGGGYPKDHLSLVSLEWMMNEASKCGLIFRYSQRKDASQGANHNGTMYDSRAGFSAFYRYKPRDIKQLIDCYDPNNDCGAKVHISVFQRIIDSPDSYSPVNMPQDTESILTQYATTITENPERTQSTSEWQLHISKSFDLQNNCLKRLKKHSDQKHDHDNTSHNNQWNVIWLQKIVHLLFIVFFSFFLYQGWLLTKNTPEIAITYQQPTLKGIQTLLKLINDSNPFFITEKILPGYANHWPIACVMLLIFALLMYLRRYFNEHHDNIANMIWNHSPFNINRVNAKRLPVHFYNKWLYALAGLMTTQNTLNKKIIPFFKIKVLPIIFTLFFVWLILEAILYFTPVGK